MNEYEAAVLALSGGRRYHHFTDFDLEMKLIGARWEMVRTYAWAIPDDDALELLERHAPLVEIGAGSGYWAKCLRDRGVDIVAYDTEPWEKLWTEVLVGDASKAAEHADRTLFLCWPPYGEPMARDALRAYLRAGGKKLAHVGEWGGCTGDAAFFRMLEGRMTKEDDEASVAIPRWPGMHDYLTIHERKVRR